MELESPPRRLPIGQDEVNSSAVAKESMILDTNKNKCRYKKAISEKVRDGSQGTVLQCGNQQFLKNLRISEKCTLLSHTVL